MKDNKTLINYLTYGATASAALMIGYYAYRHITSSVSGEKGMSKFTMKVSGELNYANHATIATGDVKLVSRGTADSFLLPGFNGHSAVTAFQLPPGGSNGFSVTHSSSSASCEVNETLEVDLDAEGYAIDLNSKLNDVVEKLEKYKKLFNMVPTSGSLSVEILQDGATAEPSEIFTISSPESLDYVISHVRAKAPQTRVQHKPVAVLI